MKEEKIKNLLSRNVEVVFDKNHLQNALLLGKKLRVKFGIDPTGEKIHIGRAVALKKLKEFQRLGHKIVLIIGDFTAQIGDPSDKLSKRPFLTEKQIKENMKNYLPQIGKILDIKKCEIHYNSSWLKKLNFRDICNLADIFTINQMLERRNFAERFKQKKEISLREFLYPLMQGYDSVAIKADVEIGGYDQLFNLHAGRKIQEFFGQKPQDIMTTKMLLGLDGRKMSTSWGNVINIDDPPDEQYGKIMSMRDEMIEDYLYLATDLEDLEIKKILNEIKLGKLNPRDAKKIIAFNLVSFYWGENKAKKAQEKFEKLFSKKEIPKDLPILKLSAKKLSLEEIVLLSKAIKSKSEAKRLITQGGFDINSQKFLNPKELIELKKGDIIKIGKYKFFKVE